MENVTPEDARKRIVETLKPGREYTTSDIATLAKIPQRQAGKSASVLCDMGILKRDMIPKEGVTVFALNTGPEVHGVAPSAD